MADFARAVCDSCQAEIIWTVTRVGRRAPIDYTPATAGTIGILHRPGQAPLSQVVSEHLRFGRKDLRTSHFASCPNAARHRKRGRS